MGIPFVEYAFLAPAFRRTRRSRVVALDSRFAELRCTPLWLIGPLQKELSCCGGRRSMAFRETEFIWEVARCAPSGSWAQTERIHACGAGQASTRAPGQACVMPFA